MLSLEQNIDSILNKIDHFPETIHGALKFIKWDKEFKSRLPNNPEPFDYFKTYLDFPFNFLDKNSINQDPYFFSKHYNSDIFDNYFYKSWSSIIPIFRNFINIEVELYKSYLNDKDKNIKFNIIYGVGDCGYLIVDENMKEYTQDYNIIIPSCLYKDFVNGSILKANVGDSIHPIASFNDDGVVVKAFNYKDIFIDFNFRTIGYYKPTDFNNITIWSLIDKSITYLPDEIHDTVFYTQYFNKNVLIHKEVKHEQTNF